MVSLNRPQIPEHFWAVPEPWRVPLADLHAVLTALDPWHLVTQVATRKGRLRVHLVPSIPFDEDDHAAAALHNLMWMHVHRTEDRILAHTDDQGDKTMSSFLEEVHTELHSLWQSMENKSSQFAQLFKGVTDKVGAQVATEAEKVAPELEADAAKAVKDVEAEAPAVEADLKTDTTEAVAAAEQAATK